MDSPRRHGGHGEGRGQTDEEDLAATRLEALEAVGVGHGRFEAVFIAGDEAEEEHNLSKAKRLLGWQPRSHHYLG